MADSITRSTLLRAFSILCIDDSDDYQFLIRHCLQFSIPPAEPSFYSTAHQALAFLEEISSRPTAFPKLVLLDIYLPSPETGWHLLKTIRTNYPIVPVVVLSAFQDVHHVKQAYDLGAHSFLGKPTDIKKQISSFKTLYEYWGTTVTLPADKR